MADASGLSPPFHHRTTPLRILRYPSRAVLFVVGHFGRSNSRVQGRGEVGQHLRDFWEGGDMTSRAPSLLWSTFLCIFEESVEQRGIKPTTFSFFKGMKLNLETRRVVRVACR